MKTRVLIGLVVAVVLAAVMTGSAFAQSNSAFLNSFSSGGYSSYSSHSGYSYASTLLEPVLLWTILGGATAAVLGGGAPYIIGGAVLGGLLGQSMEAQAAQRPEEYREWYYDSTTQRDGWRAWGRQHTKVPMGNTPPMRVWGRPQLPREEQRFEELPAQPIEP